MTMTPLCRSLGIDVPIGRGGNRVFSDRAIEVLVEEGVRIAIIVTGSPEVYTARLKQAGYRIERNAPKTAKA